MTKPILFDPFIVALRRRKGKIPADLYADIEAAWEAVQRGGGPPAALAPTATSEPAWTVIARGFMGTKEIPGAKHNSAILKWFADVGASWIKDDETPWCGAFHGAVLKLAGLPIVDKGLAVRAKAWADWGKACPMLTPGATVVFGREGGGHVGQAVGISADGKSIYTLGGNQRNEVNITPIARDRLLPGDAGVRWPAHLPLPTLRLPVMTGGVISTNER